MIPGWNEIIEQINKVLEEKGKPIKDVEITGEKFEKATGYEDRVLRLRKSPSGRIDVTCKETGVICLRTFDNEKFMAYHGHFGRIREHLFWLCDG